MADVEEQVPENGMVNMHFKHRLTRSNVDKSTHGVVSAT